MCVYVPLRACYNLTCARFRVLATTYQKLLIYSLSEQSENLELTSPELLKMKPLTQRSPRQKRDVSCFLPAIYSHLVQRLISWVIIKV